MPVNIGIPDRVIRLVLGVILIVLPFVLGGEVWQWIAAAVGLVLIATAAVGFCPLYRLLRLSTSGRR